MAQASEEMIESGGRCGPHCGTFRGEYRRMISLRAVTSGSWVRTPSLSVSSDALHDHPGPGLSSTLASRLLTYPIARSANAGSKAV